MELMVETRTEPASRLPAVRLLSIMLGIVGLNLLAALLLDQAAGLSDRLSVTSVVLVGTVLGINGVRFIVWRIAHRRYRFADVMPLSALFFPLVGLASWLQGEPMTWRSVAGIALITAGAWTLARNVDGDVR